MSSSRIERKLAAIMFTDIAGYTALSAKDENKALALLDTQKQILTPIIEEFNGTLHKEMGDGLLFTFPTVTEAVKCGIKIQEETKANDDLNLRIGIHEGEITLKDGDALGDDVNVASRIEAFAPSGGIAISSKVQQNISSLPEFETSYVGKPELKGVAQEVKVYCIISHGLPKADEIDEPVILKSRSNFNIFALSGGILTAIGIAFWIAVGVFDVSFGENIEVPSIAIIPFENKGNSDDDYYAYSIISDLISDITGSGLIRVASLNDIEKLNYKRINNNELSEKLLVRYIAQGTLWKKDSIFQFSIELFDTETSDIVLNKRWEKDWNNLPIIKGELAENIINALNVSSSKNFKHIITNNTIAYDYYLKGKFSFISRNSFDDIKYAREMLKKALELDSNLLEAEILLGRSYLSEGQYDEAKNHFISCINNSILIGNQKTEAGCNNYLGDLSLNFSFDEAKIYYDKALNIYENLSDSYSYSLILYKLALLDFWQYNYDDAIENLDTALEYFTELDDLNNMSKVYNKLGEIYFSNGDFEKSLIYYNKSEERFESNYFSDIIIDDVDIITTRHNAHGNYIKSLEYYDKLSSYAKSHGDATATSYCYIKIGNIHSHRNNNMDALKYYLKAYKILSGLKNYKRTCTLSINIAELYYEEENMDSSLTFYKSSLEWCSSYQDHLWKVYPYMIKIYINNGNLKKIHSLNDRLINHKINRDIDMLYFSTLKRIGSHLVQNLYYEEGLITFQKAYDYYENNFDLFNEFATKEQKYYWYLGNPGIVLNSIGRINYIIGNYEKAIEYAYNSIEITKTFNEMVKYDFSEWRLVQIYYSLADILFETTGNNSELIQVVDYLVDLVGEDELNRNYNLIDHLIFKNKLNIYLNKEINKKDVLNNIENYINYIKPDKLNDVLSFIQFYDLYLIIEDKSYLETAYNQVQEKADNLDPDVATKFLSYPIPKAIIEEWEKVK